MNENDAQVLKDTYRDLLNARDAMLNGLIPVQESEFQRELMVDSLINGVMSHLQEVAPHAETIYRDRISQNGGIFSGYATLVAGNVAQRVSAIAAELQKPGA